MNYYFTILVVLACATAYYHIGETEGFSWTVPDGEDRHMFTVGAPASVPAPAALVLTAVGTTVFGWLRRRRTLQDSLRFRFLKGCGLRLAALSTSP